MQRRNAAITSVGLVPDAYLSPPARTRARGDDGVRGYPTPLTVITIVGPGPVAANAYLSLSRARARTRDSDQAGGVPPRDDHDGGAWSRG
jgi:hypothetical protein